MALKIGFVLLSNSRSPIPSTRIAVLNMFPFLREAGYDPQIVFEPAAGSARPDVDALLPQLRSSGVRIVVFQKVHGSSVEALARSLSRAGIRTVYCVCDVVDAPMADACDATVVVTDFLKSLYPAALRHKISVVHDGIELPSIHKQHYGGGRGSLLRPLNAVLVTSAHLDQLPAMGPVPDWLRVTIVGRYQPTLPQRLRQARWTYSAQADSLARRRYLAFLMNPRIRCVAWDAVTVYEHMRSADLGIIPIDVSDEGPDVPAPNWKVKSENRLTLKMCVGLPVIATPIPAYEPVIEQGRNGFLAATAADWAASLETLRDPATRESMGREARASVLQRYSMQEQARRLMDVFAGLLSASNTTPAQSE